MSIESINVAGMTYQGSTSQVTEKQGADVTVSDTQEQNAAATAVNITEKKQDLGKNSNQNTAKQTEQIKKAIENINKSNPQTEAIFALHEGTNRVMIKIIDKDTKKVIKEYPPEKTLDMIEKVWEMAGLMVDEKR